MWPPFSFEPRERVWHSARYNMSPEENSMRLLSLALISALTLTSACQNG